MVDSSFAGKLGWQVGRKTWLDSPSSKVSRYWRAIEYGSTASMGEIIGLWTNSPGSNARPNRLRGPAMDPFEAPGGQKFAPFQAKRGQRRESSTQAALLYYFGVEGGDIKTATNLGAINILPGSNKRRDPKTGKMESRGSGPAAKRRVLFMLLQKAARGEKVPFVRGDVRVPMKANYFYDATTNSAPWAQDTIIALGKQMGFNLLSKSGIDKAHRQFALDTVGDPKRAKKVGPEQYNREDYFSSPSLASFGVGAVGQSFLQGPGGQFPPGQWQAFLTAANKEMAYKYQQELIARMNRSRRTRVATGDLIKAHGADENRFPR